ncbi:hypothetical protein D7Z94_09390 [Ulvibacterium marinum]|uniref:Uncharacterized protein n=1 Tax=Ulvibacterium marinum TaxID=2419782 RepID=A0A3B0CDX1_9FLAO|nr:hypothetical protein D7Z94_09390 [Ulvibacterium marinum]
MVEDNTLTSLHFHIKLINVAINLKWDWELNTLHFRSKCFLRKCIWKSTSDFESVFQIGNALLFKKNFRCFFGAYLLKKSFD